MARGASEASGASGARGARDTGLARDGEAGLGLRPERWDHEKIAADTPATAATAEAGGAESAQTAASASAKGSRSGWAVTIGCFVLMALILVFTPGALNLDALGGASLKPPELAPLLAMSALVQFHVYTVALALLIGPLQFVLRKGTAAHRVFGWIWAAAMLSTAIATFFIRDMRDGAFSGIHLFSLMALIGVPLALWLARVKVMSHARAMTGLYIGLVIAGITAIAPGRLIWEMFFR